MRRAMVAVAALAALAACKKKESKPSDAIAQRAPAPGPQARAPEVLAPLPAATAGPVYASIWGKGIARFDTGGWQSIGPAMNASLVLGGDALWAISSASVWRYDGSAFAEIPAKGRWVDATVAPDGTLWVITEGTLARLEGTEWVTEPLPGNDPPRGVRAVTDGLWVRTLDRTYRRRGGAWSAVDVPGVTGTENDLVALATHGDDAYLATGSSILKLDGGTWKPIALGRTIELGDRAQLVAGPGGRFAVGSAQAVLGGDTKRGLRPLDLGGTDLHPSLVSLSALDDRGRTWAVANGHIFVFDELGTRIKHWTRNDSPLLDASIVNVVVGRGGPAHLDAGERAAVTVTGKVEGSAAGLEIVACSDPAMPYGGGVPCMGVPNARTTKTAAGGAFVLANVPLVPTYFFVKRGGRWRKMISTDCCAQLPPDGSSDLGTLTLE